MANIHCKLLPPDVYLLECFTYDRSAGTVTWRKRPQAHFKSIRACNAWNARYSGQLIKHQTSHNGYTIVRIDSKGYYLHRLIWEIVSGHDPLNEIDHRNRDRRDNRWENLREATTTQQKHNQGQRRNNTTGYKGVYRHNDRYIAQITIDGRGVHLGSFDTAELAHAAYREAARSHHGEFFHG